MQLKGAIEAAQTSPMLRTRFVDEALYYNKLTARYKAGLKAPCMMAA